MPAIRPGRICARSIRKQAASGNCSRPTDGSRLGRSDLEIQIVTSASESEPACDRLRVNDPATKRPRWEADLPFSVTNTHRDGGRFFVFGSTSDSAHFVARLNWRTGAVERIWSGIPILFDFMYTIGPELIGVGITEGAVAIRVGN